MSCKCYLRSECCEKASVKNAEVEVLRDALMQARKCIEVHDNAAISAPVYRETMLVIAHALHETS